MWYSIKHLIRANKPLFLLLFFVVFPLLISPDFETSADSNGMIEVIRDVGYIDFVAFGIGTRGDPITDDGVGEGAFSVNITRNMTAVREAHLIWTGRTEDKGQANIYDDDGVMLSINGAIPVNVMANLQFIQDPWFKGDVGQVAQLHESGDITALVESLIPTGGSYTGNITFDISDQEHGLSSHGTSPDYDLNYGAGVWIIYEYEGAVGEPYSEVIMFEGQDSFFRNWTSPRGPHSDVQCVSFPAANYDRPVTMTHLVSGVDLQADLNNKRSSAFWYKTGAGTPPTYASPAPGIINDPDAIGYRPNNGEYPLSSSAGLEWDNFEPANFVVIPANDTWVCLQIESGDSQDLAGLGNTHLPASGMWNFFGVRLASDVPPPPPTAVSLTQFKAEAADDLGVKVTWQTVEEINNFGYTLYRGESNDFASAESIHFEPTAVSGGTGMGKVYVYQENVLRYGNYYYWLEDVDTEGQKQLHGPVMVQISRIRAIYLPLIMQ